MVAVDELETDLGQVGMVRYDRQMPGSQYKADEVRASVNLVSNAGEGWE